MAKAILYDATKCTGCRGCQVACKQWNGLPAEETTNRGTYENPADLSPTTWVKMRFNEVGSNGSLAWLFSRQACMHCTDAGCVKVCPTGALYHHGLGFVAYDKDLCSGCGYCVEACPFNVPRLDGSKLTGKAKMDKCIFCGDRVTTDVLEAGNRKPACVKTCPTGALSYGERVDMVAAGKARVTELGGDARLYGETEVGGTHVMYVLDRAPEDYLLPANPKVSDVTTVWQDVLQPLGYGVVGLVAVGLAVNFMAARARMIQDKEDK